MEFRILGPLEVWCGGRAVDLGSGRDRTILALLLLSPNRTVGVDRLVRSLWERPPASARKNVQTRIWALRRLFTGTGGDARIESGPVGYRLRVGADELDASRFDRWVAEGQQALAAGEPELAARRLRAALALWRGAPLSDVPLPAADSGLLVRWQERRQAAVEDRVEAELRCGRHVELIAELHQLVADDPLRERPWAQLMLALYRGGRQADALHAYAHARRTFRDDLGLDPGPMLQRLHRQILNRDPALDLAPATDRYRPNQLPADTDLAGRSTEYRRLAGAVAARSGTSSPVAAIVGGPGTGKTALAVHLAHRVAEHFPDGQLYLDLGDLGDPQLGDTPQPVLRLLRDLGVPADRVPGGDGARAALYRSALAGRRYLIVLDNAADETQVRPLLPGSAGCAVVVTSRRRLSGLTGAYTVTLGPLGTEPALTLLSRMIGAPRVAAERSAARELVALCGGLPLALRVAGARLAARPTWPLAHLVRRLADERERLAELSAGDLDVSAAFESSYGALTAAEQDLFRRLGTVAADGSTTNGSTTDIDARIAAQLTGRTVRAAERLLERLVDAHLVEAVAPDRYRLPGLLRLYARDVLSRGHTGPMVVIPASSDRPSPPSPPSPPRRTGARFPSPTPRRAL